VSYEFFVFFFLFKWIYIEPCPTHRTLRHGSHSFTCKLHHACLDSPAAVCRASPPFCWYSFYRLTEGRRLSRPGTVNVVPQMSVLDFCIHYNLREQKKYVSLSGMCHFGRHGATICGIIYIWRFHLFDVADSYSGDVV